MIFLTSYYVVMRESNQIRLNKSLDLLKLVKYLFF